MDLELVDLLVGECLPAHDASPEPASPITHVTTGERVGEMTRRLGQAKFSKIVKTNFREQCCFPGCEVSGSAFLIAGHIDRWSDNPSLRGDISNGLCLCLLHDKAFELGLFTVTADNRIHLHDARCKEFRWAPGYFRDAHGTNIRPSGIQPSLAALAAHWRRHGIKP